MDRRDLGTLLLPAVQVLGLAAPDGSIGVKRGHDGGFVLDARWMVGVPLGAALRGGTGSARFGVHHLEHLLPAFADRGRIRGLAMSLPETWVYFRVAGAKITGDAVDGTVVIARVPFAVRGAPREWEAWSVARGGHWAMTVPLPTSWRSGGIES